MHYKYFKNFFFCVIVFYLCSHKAIDNLDVCKRIMKYRFIYKINVYSFFLDLENYFSYHPDPLRN